MSLFRALLVRLARASLLVIVARTGADWGAAMILESEHLKAAGEKSGSWIASCLHAAVMMRLRDVHTLTVVFYVALTALTIKVDWQTNAVVPSLGLIITTGAALGYLLPDKRILGAGMAGAVVPGAHAVADFSRDLWPFYQYERLGLTDWLILSSLFAPAALAVLLGARVRTWSRQ